MNSLNTLKQDLRNIDARWAASYVGSILKGNDFWKHASALLPKGKFYASAPRHLEISSSRSLEAGFKDTGYSFNDRIDHFKSDLGYVLILDPYFKVSELGGECQNTEYIDTNAGAWQSSDTSQLKCCLAACNYFFPLSFIMHKQSKRLSDDAIDERLYEYVVSETRLLVVDAFDNDGFLLWERRTPLES